ncbi:sirohydrochlorin chelatase [Streptomyces sp. NPDC057302]|uniref:sirohydrochlorin chelatase n=1 Tax=Streptomyces sp. NPDC057302 TaxID=3346094 RepID=UPI00362DE875
MASAVAAAVQAGAATVVHTGGHECGPDMPGFHVVRGGRRTMAAVSEALVSSDAPVCVVPMTLGRDPRLVADTARALRWLAADEAKGRLVLAEPFGTKDHLISWLRTAVQKAASWPGHTADSAILITATAAGPFEDAELFRIARLVRQYGQHRLVEVAFTGGDPDLEEGVERCLRLGADRVTMVPAGFGASGARRDCQAVDGGPLLSPSAISGVLQARTREALHRLAHGHDGIHGGLDAEHGHGYAHSHPHDTTTGHTHITPHAHHH